MGWSFVEDRRSSAAIARENGWTAGDILEGTETYGDGTSSTCRILITAVGDEMVLAKTVMLDGKPQRSFEQSWSLACRDWKKCGRGDGT